MALMPCIAKSDQPQNIEDFTPVIKFDHTGIDLGEMTQDGGKKPFSFKFVNEGNAPLVLTYVHASCSCIGLEYPRHPIAPGDSATVKGYLNPASISEPTFQRNILIRSNAQPSQTRVFITGKIKK